MKDVVVARGCELDRRRMHNGEQVILAQGVGKKGFLKRYGFSLGVTIVAGRVDILVDEMDEFTLAEID